MTIDEARALLGPSANGMTDEQVRALRDEYRAVAQVIVQVLDERAGSQANQEHSA